MTLDRKKIGKQSKEKGKRYERHIANIFKDFGFNARRTVQYKGTGDSFDVEADTPIPLNIECKYVQKLNLRKAYTQAEQEATGGTTIICHGKPREVDLVTLGFKDFLDILREIDLK